MFKPSEKFLENYFQKTYKLINAESKIKKFDIDFDKPWWHVLLAVKWDIIAYLAFTTIKNIYEAILPILIALAFNTGQFINIFWVVLGWVFVNIVLRQTVWGKYLMVYSNLKYNLNYAGQKRFLTADPVHHSTKSTGQILSKMSRLVDSFDDFLTIYFERIYGTLIRMLTSIGSFFVVGWAVGLVSLGATVLISAFSLIVTYYSMEIYEKKLIEKFDKSYEISVENLNQTIFIRSIFGTQKQLQKFDNVNKKSEATDFSKWYLQQILVGVGDFLLTMSLALIGYFLFLQIQSGELLITTAISVFVSFWWQSGDILWVSNDISKANEALVGIKDFWKFHKKFGKQTYPVVED